MKRVIDKKRRPWRIAIVGVLTLALVFTALPFGSVAVKGGDSPYVASAETLTGTGCTFDTETDTLTVSANSFSLPAGVDKEEDVVHVIIQNSVTEIRELAFENYEAMVSITIPNSVTRIEFEAFYNCLSLTSITIPDSVMSIEEAAFNSCQELTSINIPASVTSIGPDAFVHCYSLSSISVANDNGYYSDVNGVLFNKSKTSLISYPNGKPETSYTTPSNTTSIEPGAFNSCELLTSIVISNGVISIGEHAFVNSSLKSITLSGSVESIDDKAFRGAFELISIFVGNDNPYFSDIDGVLFSKNRTKLIHYPCGKADTSYTIPSGVTNIGERAFEDCSTLTSVTIPNGVTDIGWEAFTECYVLTSITIPNSVTSIGGYAFYLCSPLLKLRVVKDSYAHNYAVSYGIAVEFMSAPAPTTCTVTFNANGGTAVTARTVNAGAAVGALPASTRTDYILLGWYTAPVGGVKVVADTIVSGDVTYYAQWALHGWVNSNGSTYHYDTGVAHKDWQTIDGSKYYFDVDGKMKTGLQKISGKTYYFGTDGKMCTGWQTVAGKKYYFDSDGAVKTGWQTISKKKYYLGSDGAAKTGWQTISKKKYYFGIDGAMKTGWQTISKKKYYFGKDGAMKTAWQKIGGKKYYFGKDGKMRTGWQKISGKKYYFKSNGQMVTGKVKIKGKNYKFNRNGVLVK